MFVTVLIQLGSVSADQTQTSNYTKARKLHWSHLYTIGGFTLYCGQSFETKDGLNIEHIYPASKHNETETS